MTSERLAYLDPWSGFAHLNTEESLRVSEAQNSLGLAETGLSSEWRRLPCLGCGQEAYPSPTWGSDFILDSPATCSREPGLSACGLDPPSP